MSKPATSTSFDPMKAWRDWFVRNEREWSESLTRVMKDEAVARAVGQEINATLYRQQMFSQGMAGPMAMMNMPTRDDIVTLGERMGQLEDAVARVEAALAQLKADGPADTPRPPRTRKPPRGAAATATAARGRRG